MFVKKEPTLTPEDSKKLAKIMEHMIETSDTMVKEMIRLRGEILSDAKEIALLLSGIEEVEDG
jgi:hypothetical protein